MGIKKIKNGRLREIDRKERAKPDEQVSDLVTVVGKDKITNDYRKNQSLLYEGHPSPFKIKHEFFLGSLHEHVF